MPTKSLPNDDNTMSTAERTLHTLLAASLVSMASPVDGGALLGKDGGTHRHGSTTILGPQVRYEFRDGSALVWSAASWDVGFSGHQMDCWCWLAEHHEEDCPYGHGELLGDWPTGSEWLKSHAKGGAVPGVLGESTLNTSYQAARGGRGRAVAAALDVASLGSALNAMDTGEMSAAKKRRAERDVFARWCEDAG